MSSADGTRSLTMGSMPMKPLERTTRLKRISAVVAELVASGTAVSARDGTVHQLFPVAVPPAEGHALRDWVIREAAVSTIEIGLGYAISTLFICEGLLETGGGTARHVAIDPFQSTRFANLGLQFLDEAGVADMVEFHEEDSRIALVRFLAEERTFDLAFVDANHRFDGVFVDLAYLARLVRPGGVVFLDDYQLPAIQRALSFWQKNVGWTVEEVSAPDNEHQWVVVRTPATPDARPYDHFLDF
jgi:predicted O-methyltransferase YrrM